MPPKSNKKSATHPENQVLIDKLVELSSKPFYMSNPNYSRMFTKAIASIRAHPAGIQSRKEVKELKGIGDWIATRLFPKDGGARASEPAGKRKEAAKKGKKADRKDCTELSCVLNDEGKGDDGSGEMSSTCNPSSSSFSVPLAPRIPTYDEARKLAKKLSKVGANGVISEKSMRYLRATEFGKCITTAGSLSDYTNWRVILLVDQRERNKDDVQSKLLQCGVKCEIRTLPIGDMLWIARGFHKKYPSRSLEVNLGTIIERKTADDLASSIYGTRHAEQRLRLKYSAVGAEQIIYLCEARSLREDAGSCPSATLRSALAESFIRYNFAIIHTKNETETIKCLRRLHRRIIRRSFSNQCGCWSSPLFSPQSIQKKLPDSMVFNSPPVPFETDRLHTYDELDTKIHYTREKNMKNVQSVFRAQLKQIDSLARSKIDAITSKYTVPIELMEAYRKIMKEEGPTSSAMLVRDIETNSTNSIRNIRVGPKSSKELHYMYTCKVGEEVATIDEKKLNEQIKEKRDDFFLSQESSASIGQVHENENYESVCRSSPLRIIDELKENTPNEGVPTSAVHYKDIEMNTSKNKYLTSSMSLFNATKKFKTDLNAHNLQRRRLFSPNNLNPADVDINKNLAHTSPCKNDLSSEKQGEKLGIFEHLSWSLEQQSSNGLVELGESGSSSEDNESSSEHEDKKCPASPRNEEIIELE